MFKKSSLGDPETKEIQDIHGSLPCPGTWRIAWQLIRVPGK